MGGNLESERAAEREALVHDGAEEMKGRIGGPGSNVPHNSFHSQPTCFCHPFYYRLTISTYISYRLPMPVRFCECYCCLCFAAPRKLQRCTLNSPMTIA